MANHVRTQCRDAVVTLLTNLTTTATRVFAGRPETRPLQANELPGLLVHTTETESAVMSRTGSGRRMQDLCSLVIVGYARSTGDVDATLDTMEKEVRAALGASTLGGLAKDLFFAGSAKEDDPDAEKPTWRIRMTFTLEYHTSEAAPDAALA